jgi:hypothetical protein
MTMQEIQLRNLSSRFRPGSSTWATKPSYCSGAHFESLLDVRRWDDAVDLGVAFQRGLREMEGWIRMIEARKDDALMTVAGLQEVTMPVANDDWLGLWVNGMTEAGVLLLMKQKVPCFIVHEFPPETPVLRSAVPRPPTFFSFVEGTDVVYLVRNNTYQLLAESQGRLDSLFRAEDGRGEHVPTDPRNEERSSSLYMTSCPPWVPRPRPQMARMTAGGWGARTASGALITAAAPGARMVTGGGGA